MQDLATITTWTFNFLGKTFSVNPTTLVMTAVVAVILLIFSLFLSIGASIRPTKRQILAEMLIEWFQGILDDSIGEGGRRYLTFVLSIFLFVLICNWISVIPTFKSPTRDLNTPLALALLVLIVAHVSAIRKKGLKKYLKAYFEPFWFLFPSNVISEFSKTLSHSFRLFGNMFAGGVVIALVPILLMRLPKILGVPLVILSQPVLSVFFGLFIGGIQAFVFSILAIAYIGVLQQE